MRVDQLCSIQTGFTARGRLIESPAGTYALQLRDLSDERDWSAIEPSMFDLGQVKDRYYAGPGDILFRSRGTSSTATAIPAEWPFRAVAVLPLLVLKPNERLIRPDFLVWSINRPDSQQQLERNSRGSSLRMVPTPALAELHIDVPDLPTQDKILLANSLSDRTWALEREAARLKHSLTGAKLREAAQRAAKLNTKGVSA